MKLTRPQKEQLIIDMSGKLSQSKPILLVNYQGLKVKEIRELKKKLWKEGIGFQIIKNTLFKIALKQAGLSIEESLLDQPVAIVWGKDDEVTSSKIAVEFGKTDEKMKIIGGVINNQYVDIEIIKKLAVLPGRQELYAKLVGTLNAPMFRLVNVLQGNLRNLVYLLKQYSEQKVS